MDFIKAEQVGPNKWRVLSVPYGGPFAGKDFDEEFFSARTDIKPDWFDRRPLIWHHGQDATMKADPVIGTADDTVQEDEGWWSTIWLDRAHRYWNEVNALLNAGKVYGSSGALAHMVKKDHKSGEILVWPFIEQTLTPTPANPFSRVVAAKAIGHFDAADLSLAPVVRELISDPSNADLPSDLATAGDEAARLRALGIATAQAAAVKARNL